MTHKPYFAKYLLTESEHKLFLCNRNVQVRDIVYHNYMAHIRDISQSELVEDDEDRDFLLSHNAYKVIGEISPEATWVTEGMEFEQNELRVLFIHDTEFMEFTPSVVVQHISYIAIKGPCGHFH